jgi:two-component system sensor histidine kinase YesM
MKEKQPKRQAHGVKNQILRVFFLCGILPILALGIYGCLTARSQMMRQYNEQISADVTRVRSILFDITTAVYQNAESLIVSRDCRTLLAAEEAVPAAGALYSAQVEALEELRSSAAVSTVHLYTDNPNLPASDWIVPLSAQEMEQANWYGAAAGRWSCWTSLTTTSRSGREQYELCLVRRIAVASTEYRAYLVVSLDRNYLKNRLEQTSYRILLNVEGEPAFYATDNDGFGEELPCSAGTVGEGAPWVGEQPHAGRRVLTAVERISAYRANVYFTIVLQDDTALGSIRRTTLIYLLIALIAVAVPALIILVFSRYFTGRVQTLKTAMHQASTGDYEIAGQFGGDDELRDIFVDLQITVAMVRDAEARYYQSLLNEQQLINRQQQMEFKLLASQINPHFLYNTLEMIRMQALAAGAKEVATSIKLLGKSMHYVLETTGTRFTTLDRELDYVKTYLTIQQLRFGDRVAFAFDIPESFHPAEYKILPLLLQPVVENAVTHGLKDSTAPGLVTIGASVRAGDGELVLSVEDNGRGIPPEEAAKIRDELQKPRPAGTDGIALCNINQRIRLAYGARYGLRFVSRAGTGTRVELALPLHIEAEVPKEETPWATSPAILCWWPMMRRWYAAACAAFYHGRSSALPSAARLPTARPRLPFCCAATPMLPFWTSRCRACTAPN